MIDHTIFPAKEIQNFIHKYNAHSQILIDFYKLLSEEQMDFKIVENESKRSDTPRESFAHIVNICYDYLNGAKSKELNFGENENKNLSSMTKDELVAAFEKFEHDLIEYLNSPEIQLGEKAYAPWGETDVAGLLYSMIDHLILHAGWNLALIDLLNLPRFDSLKEVWGE